MSNYCGMRRFITLYVLVFLSLCSSAQTSNKYNVYTIKSDTLQLNYLLKRQKVQFDLRRESVADALSNKERLSERRENIKNWYNDIVGELPAKTPLNPIVARRDTFKHFSIEWLAYESCPGHHVTSMLYVPREGNPPYPAVYIPCGHSYAGKGGETYQKAARLFASNGFIALVADPVCQGERMQYLDEAGKPATEARMLMHEVLGQKLLLTGSNILIHELWDNSRGLDFLEQHPLVDSTKLAVAGNSGGGTQTTYLVAFDNRVKVATPSCYIATTEKKFSTIGSQDGCQQLWGEGNIGIEEQDFLFIASPKPICILSAQKDFFNIDGAQNAYNELKKEYAVLGVPDKVSQVVAPGKHGWSKPLREASVSWCRKWLLGDFSMVTEAEDVEVFTNAEDVRVTKTGQVLTSFKNEKSVTQLTQQRLMSCSKKRENYLLSHSKDELIGKSKELLGFTEQATISNFEELDTVKIGAYEATKILLARNTPESLKLPALLFKQAKASTQAVTIVVSEFGKKHELQNESFVLEALKKGHMVLAIDISNTGELKNHQMPKYDNKEFWLGKLAMYEGRSILTYRTEDIINAINFLRQEYGTKIEVNINSNGLTGPAALHAALFDGGVNEVLLKNSISSWSEMAGSEYVSNLLGNVIPGVLNYYDLPNFAQLIPGTQILIKP